MSAKSTRAIHHPASNSLSVDGWAARDAVHNGDGRGRIDKKATYSRAMDVPEGALLAVKDLSVELVSFLIHSKQTTHRDRHTRRLERELRRRVTYIHYIVTSKNMLPSNNSQ